MLMYIDMSPYILSITVAHVIVTLTVCQVDVFFFFQAEDGIRDVAVTGVQTCALPISQRVAQKCRVILLAQEGMSNHSIAKQLGLSRPTVIAARAAFGTGGVQVLTAKPTRNRPRRTLTAELEKRILDTTLKTRPPDATQWTVRTLAKHLRVSRMMVHRVWQRFDIQPHRVEKLKLSNDPQFEEKVRDIAGLYLDPPERALVLCVDEKSQIQALDRTAPILPLRPGLPERQTHDYKRYG